MGLTTATFFHQHWQVNTIKSIDNRYTIMVAEHANYRQKLESRLTQHSIFIMLLSYPFLGALIWFIVERRY